jgi:hypothetical protein
MKPYALFNLGASLRWLGQRHTQTALPLGKAPGIHFSGGWSTLATF